MTLVLKRMVELNKSSMVLRNGEYKLEDDGIWIKKEVLEQWRAHYSAVSDEQFKKDDMIKAWHYMGKASVFMDLLKIFEPLEGL